MNLKKYFLILVVFELFFSYTTVFAQTVAPYDYRQAGVSDQIKEFLCAPSEVGSSQTNPLNGGLPVFSREDFQTQAGFNNKSSGDLFNCINRVYKFAIILASVVGVFFIVIAGYVYMSAEGNDESVTKAKDILVSTISSLVILFAGFILLKAINPDLVKFNSIQPPSVVGGTFASVPGGGGSIASYVIAGYNIGTYATSPNHEKLVTQIYNGLAGADFSSAAGIDAYLKRIAPSTPLTGAMILASAQKYNVDAKLLTALMQADSSLGTAGNRAIVNHNPGNVGNTDNGSNRYFPNWQAGVDAVAQWLSTHRG